MKAKSKVVADGENVPFMFQGVSQKMNITNGSTRSAAFGVNTQLVRLYATQDCHIALTGGATPTALTDGTSLFLPKSTIQYLGCTGGDKLAVIEDSADGVLYISEGI